MRRGTKRSTATVRSFPKLKLSPAKAAFSTPPQQQPQIGATHADASTAAGGLSGAQQGQQHSPPAVPWSVVPPPAKRPRQDDPSGTIALKLTFASTQQTRPQRGNPSAGIDHSNSLAAAAAAAASSVQAAVSTPAAAAASSSSAAASAARSSWREDPDLQEDLDWPEEEVLLSAYRPSQRYPPPAPQHATRMTLQITSRDVAPLQAARPVARSVRARSRSPAAAVATMDTAMMDPSSSHNAEANIAPAPRAPPAVASASSVFAAAPRALTPPAELQPNRAPLASCTPPVAVSPSPSPSVSPHMPSPASISPPLPDPPPVTAAATAQDPPPLSSSQNSNALAVPLGRRGRRPSIGSQLHQLSAVQEGDEDRIEESQRTSQQYRSQPQTTGEECKSPHSAASSASSRASSRNVSPAAESKQNDSAPPSRSSTPAQAAAAAAAAATAAASSLVPPTFSQPSSSQQSSSQLSAGPMSLWPDDYPSLSYFYEDFPRQATAAQTEDDEKREEERFQQLAQDVPVPTADDASQEQDDAPVSSQLLTQVMPATQAVVSSQMATQQLEHTPVASAATAVLPTPPASTPRVSARNAARLAAAASNAAAAAAITSPSQSTPGVGRLRRLVSSSTRHTRSHDASQA